MEIIDNIFSEEERKELIEETIVKFLKDDIDLKRTDKLLKIIILLYQLIILPITFISPMF